MQYDLDSLSDVLSDKLLKKAESENAYGSAQSNEWTVKDRINAIADLLMEMLQKSYESE